MKLGIPTISGVKNALKTLKPQTVISLNGKKGVLYTGSPLPPLPEAKRAFTRSKQSIATKLYVTLATPSSAPDAATYPIDGIGMLDGGYQIMELGDHPKKMIRDGRVKEYEARLAERIATFSKPFSPRSVMYRFSDLTSREYKRLSSGKLFEPDETNPLMGYHGAIRFLNDPELFSLEIEAVNLVRRKYELTNLSVIIPSVRSLYELREVKKVLNKHGFTRSTNGKIFLEISFLSNVIILEEFLKEGIDGLAIHADLLTAFTLGIDPRNDEVMHQFHGEHPAVLQALYHVITTAHKHDVPVTIYGQVVTLSPSLIEKLVDWGISGITVPPYALENTRKTIYNYERKLIT